MPRIGVISDTHVSIYVLHNLDELDLDPVATGHHVIISGHSHKPLVERRDGVLYLNPGSAGPRRFKLPICVAEMRIAANSVDARIVELDVSVAAGRSAR